MTRGRLLVVDGSVLSVPSFALLRYPCAAALTAGGGAAGGGMGSSGEEGRHVLLHLTCKAWEYQSVSFNYLPCIGPSLCRPIPAAYVAAAPALLLRRPMGRFSGGCLWRAAFPLSEAKLSSGTLAKGLSIRAAGLHIGVPVKASDSGYFAKSPLASRACNAPLCSAASPSPAVRRCDSYAAGDCRRSDASHLWRVLGVGGDGRAG